MKQIIKERPSSVSISLLADLKDDHTKCYIWRSGFKEYLKLVFESGGYYRWALLRDTRKETSLYSSIYKAIELALGNQGSDVFEFETLKEFAAWFAEEFK